MLHKIIATMLTLSLVSSLTFAQEMPGSALPVTSESSEELILNSAPSEPGELSLSEITVEPETNEAVISFSTSEETHVVIEYGLTPDYERSISTEPMTEHTEMLGELLACATYYYRVHIGEVSREGVFKTLCPVIKPVAKKVVKKAVVQKVAPKVMNNDEGIMNNEEELVLNAAPDVAQNDEGIMNNENGTIDEEVPESPVLPGPIAFGNDTITDEKEDTTNSIPVGLLLFALASGMVVLLFTFKKKKKWYQR